MKGDTAKRAKKLQEYYWEHRDEILRKQREKRSTPDYKARQREYYQKNKQRLNALQHDRRDIKKIERNIERDARSREQANARNNKLNRKDKMCFICGTAEGLVIHHPDYNIPFLTVTLCGSCHQKVHHKTIKLQIKSEKCPTCKNISYKVLKPILPDTFPKLSIV